MFKSLSPAERNRFRIKAKLIYDLCPDRNNWDCVMGFVDKYINESPVIIQDFSEYLKEEIDELKKTNQLEKMNQTIKLAEFVNLKLRGQQDLS